MAKQPVTSQEQDPRVNELKHVAGAVAVARPKAKRQKQEKQADDQAEPFPLLPITSENTLKTIKTFPANELDVFICSYPKSGTTWLQNIVYQILTRGDRPLDHISNFSPFLESDKTWNDPPKEVASTHCELGRRAFNTHLLPAMLPQTGQVLYVARDPKDACISFFHHLTHQAPEDGGFPGTLDEFVDDFIQGKIVFGTWQRHIVSWYKFVHDPRFLFLTYAELKASLPKQVRRIAAHLRVEPPLSEEEVERILPKLSVDWMKTNIDKFNPRSVRWLDKGDGFSFVRKGAIGDAENYLTAEQVERINKAALESTKLIQQHHK